MGWGWNIKMLSTPAKYWGRLHCWSSRRSRRLLLALLETQTPANKHLSHGEARGLSCLQQWLVEIVFISLIYLAAVWIVCMFASSMLFWFCRSLLCPLPEISSRQKDPNLVGLSSWQVMFRVSDHPHFSSAPSPRGADFWSWCTSGFPLKPSPSPTR